MTIQCGKYRVDEMTGYMTSQVSSELDRVVWLPSCVILPYLGDGFYDISKLVSSRNYVAKSKMVVDIELPQLDLTQLYATAPMRNARWIINLDNERVVRNACLVNNTITKIKNVCDVEVDLLVLREQVRNALVLIDTQGKVADICTRYACALENIVVGQLNADAVEMILDIAADMAERPALFYSKTQWTKRTWTEAVKTHMRRHLANMCMPDYIIDADSAQMKLTEIIKMWRTTWYEGDGILLDAEAQLNHLLDTHCTESSMYAGIIFFLALNARVARHTRMFLQLYFNSLPPTVKQEVYEKVLNNIDILVDSRSAAYINNLVTAIKNLH